MGVDGGRTGWGRCVGKLVDRGEWGEREFARDGGRGGRGLGARGGLTDVGRDDLGFVPGEYDIGCYANAGISVADVRLGIITCLLALPSGEGPNGMSRGIVDVDFLQVFEPDLLLPFLGDALEGDPGDDASCDLHDAVLFLRGCRAAPGAPLTLDQSDERGEGERGIAAPWKEDGEDVDGAVCGDKGGGGDVLCEEDGCEGELFDEGDDRDGGALEDGASDAAPAEKSVVEDGGGEADGGGDDAPGNGELWEMSDDDEMILGRDLRRILCWTLRR